MRIIMRKLLIGVILVVFYCGTAAADVKKDDLQVFEDLQKVIIALSDSIKPSVVHIDVVQKIQSQKFETLGSGLIIDEEGYILTNEHVVDKAQSISVTLPSKLEYPAEVIGTDKQTDLALIKINAPEKLDVARLGDSDSCKVGEWVIAVGNPYGFDRTVSFGIISGKGRVLNLPIETPLINDFIQTDAVIDPGSSGGPLVNLRGEVIGINSIGYGRGQGFTIPINIAKEVRGKLEATGTIDRGWIGIITQPLSREYAKYFGDDDLEGILVAEVFEDSPAEKAGLRSKDIIISFEGEKVSAEKEDDLNSFSQMVSSSEVGSVKSLELIRDSRKKRLKVEIGLQPKVEAEEKEFNELGLTVKEVTESMYRQYSLGTKEGVFVQYAEVGGVAGKANIEMGDIIIEVEGERVKGLEDFTVEIKANEDKDFVLLRLLRGKNRLFALLDKKGDNGPNGKQDGSVGR
ncbi:MAG: PDZ domain-containing protein [candidate division Zixibacteria bacterium]|nr:PDZ domain-containing protein [candidate division Zixibacteria bacterium]